MREKVTLKQRRAIEALLTCRDVSAAAEVAGVTRQTIYRWLKRPAFRQALQQAEADALAALQRRLVRLGATAGDVLEEAMGPEEEMRHRLRAADLVLDNLLRLRELVDLTERVEALERRWEEMAQ